MILVSPTAFKGTLSASEVAAAMAEGARSTGLRVEVRPLSDGGNGLLDALEAADGGKGKGARVSGPLGTSVTARYLIQEERVVVETAEACGLHLVPQPLLDPLRASTRGVGDLLLEAAAAAAEGDRLLVGLGGSATVDAGAGMVTALGWELLDDAGDPIPPGGAGLTRLARIVPPQAPPELPPLLVLADVNNPLLGGRGAARVYAPQKGASREDVQRLERGLERWALAVEDALGRDVSDLPGAGAAGGLGAAFATFLDASPQRGADWVLDLVGFDALLEEADVVVTGEGQWDAQSPMGKVTGEVVRRSREAGTPVLLVVGSAEEDARDGVTLVEGPAGGLDRSGIARAVSESIGGLLARHRRP